MGKLLRNRNILRVAPPNLVITVSCTDKHLAHQPPTLLPINTLAFDLQVYLVQDMVST